jgi:polysaccharide biosynthesis/export protein
MAANRESWVRGAIGLALALCACCAGCATMPVPTPPPDFPRELTKATLPEYTISPPDALLINVLRATPRPPYRIQVQDALAVQVTGTLPEQPISGVFVVEPDGTLNLGYSYGAVPVVDLTLKEAKQAITNQLKATLKEKAFDVSVGLAQSRAVQQIRGEHLVRPDGTIGLGVYGNVRVVGLTMNQAKAVIEEHLSQFLQKPEVSVDVSGFNSLVYYVITDRPGLGELVVRLPVTGNETVLDALAQIYGLPAAASKKRIWVSRPVPSDSGCEQILPVDWVGITQHGLTTTNYQLLPGDRLYVMAEPVVTLDIRLARLISPIERILGVTLLGSTTVHSIAIPLGQSTTGAGF